MKGGVNLYGFIRNMVGIFVDAIGLKMYPCDFVGPLQQGDNRGMTQGQKEALTKLLDREKKSGTKAAAKQSSVTFGDGLLEPFNSSYNPDLPINTGSLNGEFDLDWFTDINSFTHGGAAPYGQATNFL